MGMAVGFDQPVVCPVQIGRDTQLDALMQAAGAAAGGSGQLVLVSGEAGIGKSRLAQEILQRLRENGWRVLRSCCFERDRVLPYGPVTELLRSALGNPPSQLMVAQLGDRATDLARVLPELKQWLLDTPQPDSISPEEHRRRLFQVIGEVLGEAASQTPALLLVEDLHWADDASLELLQSFARSLAGHRVLLLLTYRSDEVNRPLSQFLEGLDRGRLARELHLVPLEPNHIEAMVRLTLSLDRSPQAEFLRQVSSLTEGNPFFIEELLRALIADGQLARSGGTWVRAVPAAELRVPRSVAAAVQRRCDGLDHQARRVLDMAAVVGQRFDFDLLRALVGLEEGPLLAIIRELIGTGLLVEVSAEQLAFRHALTRQAVLAQLLAREQRRLHQRVAEALEQIHRLDRQSHLPELAQHYHAAALWERALEDGRRAGEQALDLYAPDAAVVHFTRALEAAARLSLPADGGLIRARGQAREAVGDFSGALADFEQALALATEPAAVWEALLDLGSLWAGRDYERAGVWFARALEAAQSAGVQRRVARSLNRLGNWLVNVGRTAEGLELHRRALPMLEAENDRAGILETVDLLGMALALDGDVVAAVEQFARAARDFRASGNVPGLASSLGSYATFGAPLLAETSAASLLPLEEVRLVGREVVALARRSGSLAAQAYACVAMAQAFNGFGELGEALELGQIARRMADETNHQEWQTGACCVLGESYLFALAPEPAIDVLRVGFDLAVRLQSGWWIGVAASYLALSQLLASDTAGARSTLQAAWPPERVPTNASERRVAWVWGELALAEGDPELALAVAQRLLDSAPGGTRGQGVPWLHKLAGEAYLGLGRLDEASAALELARQGAVERAQRPALWQVHRALGRVQLARHAHDASLAEYARALTVVESLAAALGPEMAAVMTQHARATLPRPAGAVRRAEAQKAGGLSVREREVAQQIARGHSNREIAELLVVGERTVETHVSSILSKLGLKTRRQIATWVGQQAAWPPTAP